MLIHFLAKESMFTRCGLSTAGRESVAVTEKEREVTCGVCKALK